MADSSKIEWTDATWNPVTGCTKVSPGCDHCYAERIVERFKGKGAFERVTLNEERLAAPLKWRKPKRVFVNSMSDLFHDDVPDDYIARVFAVMAATPQHTYQVLTKRPGRMRSLLCDECRCGAGHQPGVHFRSSMDWAATPHSSTHVPRLKSGLYHRMTWPLPNVWLGVSVEDQRWADIRVPALLDTPAAVRFLSCEPLLGPVDLSKWLGPVDFPPCWGDHTPSTECSRCIQPEWVIVGGESGPGARPMHPDWATALRDRCVGAGVPFFFKQWGEWMQAPSNYGPDVPERARAATELLFRDERDVDGQIMLRAGKHRAGRELDGRTWDEYPEDGRTWNTHREVSGA